MEQIKKVTNALFDATAQKSTKQAQPFKELMERIEEYSKHSMNAEKDGNLGLAKHYIVQALEMALEERHLCPEIERQKREKLAQILLGRG